MHKNFMQKRMYLHTTAFQLLLPLLVTIIESVGQITWYSAHPFCPLYKYFDQYLFHFTFSRLLNNLTPLSLERSDLPFCKALYSDNPLPLPHTDFHVYTSKTWSLFCGMPQINWQNVVREDMVANSLIISVHVCFLFYYPSNLRHVFAQLLFRKNQQEMHLSIFSIY